MVGRTLGHYHVTAELDAGGMGVVYSAHDQHLDREVALKILPPGAASDNARRRRFANEARALSRLNHPNIAVVHDFDTEEGVDFLVMELVPGQTLDTRIAGRPLPEKEIVRLGLQLAEGLEAAHATGVLHRDLKPANLRVTPDGRLKILDFGLASLAQPCAGEQPTVTMTVGVPSGTLPYMAPEQVLNEEVDGRSDIYAAGCVLYEMATGRRPFCEPQPSRMIDAILHQPAVPPRAINAALSPELEQIILKCLEKDADVRYQSARELAVDLRRQLREPTTATTHSLPMGVSRGRRGRTAVIVVAAAAAVLAVGWWVVRGRAPGRGALATVAVLPLHNPGKDSAADYLRMAVADQAVTALSTMHGIAVRPFTMTMKYASGDLDVQRTARELRVNGVLTGYFVREGPRLRITLELTDVRSGKVLWRDTVSGPAEDLLALQQQIMTDIRRGLAAAFDIPSSAGNGTRPSNSEAYDLLLRAAALPYEGEGNNEAIRMLERSVGLDPRYAPAWSALGLRYSHAAGAGLAKCPCEPTFGDTEMADRAVAAYERALALDPELTDAAAALVLFRVDEGDLARAYEHAREMVRLRGDSAMAHFSLAYVHRYAGWLDESAHHCDVAASLDSGNPSLRACAITFMQLGNYDRAMGYVKLDQGSEWAARTAVDILLRQGRRGSDVQDALQALPKGPTYELLRACQARNSPSEIDRLSSDLESQYIGTRDAEPDYFLAAYQSYCGRPQSAARLLRRAIEHNYCSYPAMETDPFLAALRAAPDYQRLRSLGMECRNRFATLREMQRVRRTETNSLR